MPDTPRGGHINALRGAIAASLRSQEAAREAVAQIAAEREVEAIRAATDAALSAPAGDS